MTYNMKKRNYILLLCILLCAAPLMAQDASENTKFPSWYVGLQGGVPFGVSQFSSFGFDKTRTGFSGGLYGGYRFNPVLSLEAQAIFGKMSMSQRDCCISGNCWLGSDGVRYHAPVLGMEGWDYAGLKSSVTTQRYGLQLNADVLGFFPSTRQSRWSVEVSPLLAAVGTKASLSTLDGGKEVCKENTEWHLGAGGNIQAGYRFACGIGVGIYSGVTYLTGDGMDGLPKSGHKANYIWESGIRVSFAFGKKSGKKADHGIAYPASTGQPQDERDNAVETAPAEIPEQTVTDSTAQKTVVTAADNSTETDFEFPTVYFDFNSTSLRPSETSKLETILGILKEHPDMHIVVTGWCDTSGSRSVNERYSIRRAEAVKLWLEGRGIAAGRITAVGRGSDVNEKDAEKARRAEVTDKERKEDRR